MKGAVPGGAAFLCVTERLRHHRMAQIFNRRMKIGEEPERQQRWRAMWVVRINEKREARRYVAAKYLPSHSLPLTPAEAGITGYGLAASQVADLDPRLRGGERDLG